MTWLFKSTVKIWAPLYNRNLVMNYPVLLDFRLWTWTWIVTTSNTLNAAWIFKFYWIYALNKIQKVLNLLICMKLNWCVWMILIRGLSPIDLSSIFCHFYAYSINEVQIKMIGATRTFHEWVPPHDPTPNFLPGHC